MARPPLDEVRYVTTEAAQQALEAMAADTPALRALAHDWFPDSDEFDIRWIAGGLSMGLTAMRGLLENRRQRMIKEGRTVMPGAERTAPDAADT